MLKKHLSILLIFIMLSVSIIGISLVTAAATTENDPQETNEPTIITEETIATGGETIEPFPTSTRPTEQLNITKEELANLVDNAHNSINTGTLYSKGSQEVFDKALTFAQEILAKETPTQEELNNAYNDLDYAIKNLETVGHTATPYKLGDYDQDGDINIKDVTYIQLVLAKLFENNSYYCMADVDKNFIVNVKDATMIQLYCANFKDEVSCGYTGTESINYYFNELYSL